MTTPSRSAGAVARGRLRYSMSVELKSALDATMRDWQMKGGMRRLWAHDASLWTGADESSWLGWLDLTEQVLRKLGPLRELAGEVKARRFAHVLVLGMGGSSLCPEVLAETFGRSEGFPQLLVLDSTDPAQVRSFESKIDVKKTLFIVSSKSGSTLEPNIFKDYFLERARAALGDKAPSHFIAITDPGSKLEQAAASGGFWKIFPGVASVGGRYSALSNFGMVPAAAMGLDVQRLLERANEMARDCGAERSEADNPGLVLGAILGTLAQAGKDKVTLIVSPGVRDLGAWLEQLLAESTGKQGKGLIPVDREELAPPEAYGSDRLFVYVRLETGADAAQDGGVAALEKAGAPVVRIALPGIYELGAEFFRWEIATAVAGSILGINAFDQPDVEASKVATRKLTSDYEKTGSLPAEKPLLEEGGLRLFTDGRNAAALEGAQAGPPSLASCLRAHLGRLGQGDYLALLAYVPMTAHHEAILQAARIAVRDRKHVATCLGFGPRFLHSTGQAYKGGPASGVFLQVTCDDSLDLPLPGAKYSFGVVKAAQARGDFQVLLERDRRALRVHLGADVEAGLRALDAAVKEAVAG